MLPMRSRRSHVREPSLEGISPLASEATIRPWTSKISTSRWLGRGVAHWNVVELRAGLGIGAENASRTPSGPTARVFPAKATTLEIFDQLSRSSAVFRAK